MATDVSCCGLSPAVNVARRYLATCFGDPPEAAILSGKATSRNGLRSVLCHVVQSTQCGDGGCRALPMGNMHGERLCYATISGDMLYIGTEPKASGDIWLLDGATVNVSRSLVRLIPQGLCEPLVLRLETAIEAQSWAKHLTAAAEKSKETKRLAEQMIRDRKRRRKHFLKKSQGRKALKDAERRIQVGAAVSVQGTLVSITGLPEPPLLLRFESKLSAEEWAEQLGHFLDLRISSKDKYSNGFPVCNSPPCASPCQSSAASTCSSWAADVPGTDNE